MCASRRRWASSASNLIYGAFYHCKNPEALIGSLMDDLTRERVEVDMIRFSGPAFGKVDNRLMSLQLVQQGLTDAAMFTADGEMVQPADVLYKKSVLVERGSFRPVTNTTLDMLERAQEQFLLEPGVQGEEPVVLMEMTLRNLLAEGGVDHKDFLAAGGHFERAGQDGVDLQLRALLQAGGVSLALHAKEHRHRAGRAELEGDF